MGFKRAGCAPLVELEISKSYSEFNDNNKVEEEIIRVRLG